MYDYFYPVFSVGLSLMIILVIEKSDYFDELLFVVVIIIDISL